MLSCPCGSISRLGSGEKSWQRMYRKFFVTVVAEPAHTASLKRHASEPVEKRLNAAPYPVINKCNPRCRRDVPRLRIFVMKNQFDCVLLSLFCFAAAPVSAAPTGLSPVGKDGRPLNLDFEEGTLKDWKPDGQAF